MSVFDVRNNSTSEVNEIHFADKVDNYTTNTQAYRIKKFDESVVMIEDEDHVDEDSDNGFVLVTSKSHADNLIKALNKAVDLGWLK